MRPFKNFNSSNGDTCPVCKTNKNCETVLIPIPGTEKDGLVEAKQVHKKCYDLLVEMQNDTGPKKVTAKEKEWVKCIKSQQ